MSIFSDVIGSVFVGRDQQIAALVQWPATKRAHQQLWGAHNNYAEGDYDDATAAKIAPLLAKARAALLLGDTAMRSADDEIRKAAEQALAAKRITRADLTGAGLGAVLPMGPAAVAAVLITFLSVLAWLAIRGLRTNDETAAAQLAAVQQIIALTRAGQPVPPELVKVATTRPGNATADAVGGVGMIAVGLAALFMLSSGRRR